MMFNERIIVWILACTAVVLAAVGIKILHTISSVAHNQITESRPSTGTQPISSGGRTAPSFYVDLPQVATVPAVSRSSAPAPDVITAEAYLVGDVVSGKIYLEKDQDKVLPVASMSKLVTAIVATDTMSPTTTISITPQEADTYPDHSAIGAGESFSLKEMLYPLLLDSSNIAAEALASTSDRAHFLNLMNGYAWEIGMSDSYFGDPSGLSPHNMSTASDFFKLAKYLYSSRPDLLAITRTPSVSVGTITEHGAHDFVSIHPLISDPRFIGGKTGHTDEAADTMLSILDIDGHPIAIIVLHSVSGDRKHDTLLLAEKAASMINGQASRQ
ncbi:MAG: D-alanyl-D-alanine carboxypeptidase [Patescibacteria group bacterium]|nr:D-alanyl-D-alanine carboxypeptidase [Patescibacteria group bacterium]